MPTESTPSPAHHAITASRGWLIAGGLLSIFVGFVAMGSPLIFSIVIAQFLGIFALITGIISLGLAIFGKHTPHRILEGLSGLIRIAAGIILLQCIGSGVAIITLVLAIYFAVEGVFTIVGAIQLRGHAGWVWTLINGIAALLPGLMVYYRWPADSAWVLGLLFGINSLFSGMSFLMLGLAAPKPAATQAA